MRWKPWLVIVVSIALSAAVFAFFAGTAFRSVRPATDETEEVAPPPIDRPLVTFIDPAKGPADAPVEIVMYGDYVCPYCREAEKDIMRVLEAYPDRVRFVWKDLPNPVHQNADIAAEAAHCAKSQGKFWEYHDLLITEATTFNQAALSLNANTLGLDLDKFTSCLVGREMRPVVERSVSEAIALKIDATPYFFVDGKPYSGQPSYDRLVELVAP